MGGCARRRHRARIRLRRADRSDRLRRRASVGVRAGCAAQHRLDAVRHGLASHADLAVARAAAADHAHHARAAIVGRSGPPDRPAAHDVRLDRHRRRQPDLDARTNPLLSVAGLRRTDARRQSGRARIAVRQRLARVRRRLLAAGQGALALSADHRGRHRRRIARGAARRRRGGPPAHARDRRSGHARDPGAEHADRHRLAAQSHRARRLRPNRADDARSGTIRHPEPVDERARRSPRVAKPAAACAPEALRPRAARARRRIVQPRPRRVPGGRRLRQSERVPRGSTRSLRGSRRTARDRGVQPYDRRELGHALSIAAREGRRSGAVHARRRGRPIPPRSRERRHERRFADRRAHPQGDREAAAGGHRRRAREGRRARRDAVAPDRRQAARQLPVVQDLAAAAGPVPGAARRRGDRARSRRTASASGSRTR